MRRTFFSLLLALGCLTATAQQQDGAQYKFQPHWYLQVQPVGAQYTLGEADFKDLISYNAQLGLGYNFCPILGARLSVNGWQSKAGMRDKDIKWSWKYVAPAIDITCNLSNLFWGFNPQRFCNLTLFVGGGANFGFDNDEAQTAESQLAALHPNYKGENLTYLWDGSKFNPFGRGGIAADFRVNDVVSVGLEFNANILSDKYNSKKACNADWYFNALAGLKFNLGKSYTKTVAPEPVPEPVPVPEPIPAPVVEEPAPAPAPAVVEEKIEPIRRDVFFLINKTDIRPQEAQKVKDIADYLNKYPKAKVVVTGYADAGTGNNRINDRLAAQRADVVVKALKQQYNIAADRITYDSHGSRVQPFAENDMNRVSICIAE